MEKSEIIWLIVGIVAIFFCAKRSVFYRKYYFANGHILSGIIAWAVLGIIGFISLGLVLQYLADLLMAKTGFSLLSRFMHNSNNISLIPVAILQLLLMHRNEYKQAAFEEFVEKKEMEGAKKQRRRVDPLILFINLLYGRGESYDYSYDTSYDSSYDDEYERRRQEQYEARQREQRMAKERWDMREEAARREYDARYRDSGSQAYNDSYRAQQLRDQANRHY